MNSGPAPVGGVKYRSFKLWATPTRLLFRAELSLGNSGGWRPLLRRCWPGALRKGNPRLRRPRHQRPRLQALVLHPPRQRSPSPLQQPHQRRNLMILCPPDSPKRPRRSRARGGKICSTVKRSMAGTRRHSPGTAKHSAVPEPSSSPWGIRSPALTTPTRFQT